MGIGGARQNEIGELAEQFGLLGGLVTIGIFVDGHTTLMSLHMDITYIAVKHGIGDHEVDVVTIVRQNEVIHAYTAFCATEVSPLLVFRQEGTIKTG